VSASERLAELFGRRRFAIKPGIERIAALLEQLGHPERSFTTINVVGTNGKGSTAAFLASILTSAGHHTGLFTSPHLISYSERFQVNGQPIPQERLDLLVAELLASSKNEETFFELTTALACRHFAESGVDVAIIEAGMGGMNDATAAMPGIISVVTPISLDHCQWLGNSLQKIATEKIGITKPGITVISAVQKDEVFDIIEDYCVSSASRLLLQGRDFDAVKGPDRLLRFTGVSGSIDNIAPSLQGDYQTGNAAVAMATAEQLHSVGFPVSRQAMRVGISSARWQGRFELIELDNGKQLLLDGAHNPAGAEALSDALAEYAGRRIILLLGVMGDKDLNGLLTPLLKRVQHIITVTPAQERAVRDTELALASVAKGVKAEPAGTVAEGFKAAIKAANNGELIVAAGSLFLIGELKALIAGIPCEAVRG